MRPRPFFGVPLVLLALMWASLAFKEVLHLPIGLGQLLFFVLIAFYAGAGTFLCFSGSQLARRLGMVAWMLFALSFLLSSGPDLFTRMAVFCVITILVFKRLRAVPPNSETMQIPLKACTLEGRVELLVGLLRHYFGIQYNPALWSQSFRDVHAIAPGTLASFLDDLHSDYGFKVSGDDADSVDSISQLIELLKHRNPYELPESAEGTPP